ncbi:MAG: hypothetical protein ACP5E5_15715, partial [Acidobacteriaceae bacterium]
LRRIPNVRQRFKLSSGKERTISVGKRKVYGSAFKAKVGLEAIRGVKTENEIVQVIEVPRWSRGFSNRIAWQ